MADNLAITEKIIADARATANEISKQAKKDADEILSLCNSQIDIFLVRARDELKKECQLVKERKNTVATLDGRKIALKAKQDLIDKCFAKAEEKILAFPKNEYQAFIKSLIVEYAQECDEVIFGVTEKNLNDEFVQNVAKEMKINLTVSKNKENFEGGIILRSKVLDKNLTLKAILRGKRDEYEQETAKILFD